MFEQTATKHSVNAAVQAILHGISVDLKVTDGGAKVIQKDKPYALRVIDTHDYALHPRVMLALDDEDGDEIRLPFFQRIPDNVVFIFHASPEAVAEAAEGAGEIATQAPDVSNFDHLPGYAEAAGMIDALYEHCVAHDIPLQVYMPTEKGTGHEQGVLARVADAKNRSTDRLHALHAVAERDPGEVLHVLHAIDMAEGYVAEEEGRH